MALLLPELFLKNTDAFISSQVKQIIKLSNFIHRNRCSLFTALSPLYEYYFSHPKVSSRRRVNSPFIDNGYQNESDDTHHPTKIDRMGQAQPGKKGRDSGKHQPYSQSHHGHE